MELTVLIPNPNTPQLGRTVGPLSEHPACPSCATGTSYIRPDGGCGCFDLSQSVMFPNILGDGRGVTNTPAEPVAAPAAKPVRGLLPPAFEPAATGQPALYPAMPVNPDHAEADLWFGLEPWKVMLGGSALLLGGIYLYSDKK